MSEQQSASYGNIFKTTFVYGSVQVIRMLLALVKNKLVAILLGAGGMGIISIFTHLTGFIQTGCGLGISQSAIRDISEARGADNSDRFSRIISVVSRVVVLTSLLGAVVTVIMSPMLSKWGFGDYSQTFSFILIAIAVAANIFTENQMAILKGMRQVKAMANAGIIGSVVGLLTGVPIFFVWGREGIPASIIVTAVSGALVSNWYVRKIKYKKAALSFRELLTEASPMVRMGSVLMLSNFLTSITSMLVTVYIGKNGSLEDVGCYGAGSVLMINYFSMVTTALFTDYYPRIAAVWDKDEVVTSELNKQSLVGMTLMFPLCVIFVGFSVFFIKLLYSAEFLPAIQFTNYAVFGLLISVVSDCMGYILIAKRESKLILRINVTYQIVFLPIQLLSFKYFGLLGLGVVRAINVLSQLLLYSVVIKKMYGILANKNIYLQLLFEVVFILALVFLCQYIQNDFYRYGIIILMILFSGGYSWIIMKRQMNINMFSYVKDKIHGRKKK